MIIKKIKKRPLNNGEKVFLTSVGGGFLQGDSGSLPDVDNDFQSDKRQMIKEYYEKRYNLNGRSRVFSAGTTMSLKIKQVISDVGRIYGIPIPVTLAVSENIPKKHDNISWSEFMQLAFQEKISKGGRKVLSNFIKNYPNAVEDMRFIMNQPRSSSVHASALIITPDKRDGKDVDCFDFLPLKLAKDGILTSDFDGYSIDDIGLLKNDVLATKELTKIHNMFALIKEHYGVELTVGGFAESELNDEKVFQIVSDGFTQEIFQFSGRGMTKFIQDMQPTRFEDFIAGTSLFRPAPLEAGSAETYNDCKKGLIEPVYLWGTYDILKETYGVLTYQEQLAQMAREIGGFSISEGVRLVKLISKKKTDKIHAMKDKFMTGSAIKGCPAEDAVKIWDMIESGGSYLFNKSHATTYSVISYIGAYVKAYYPTVFYTVALDLADKNTVANILAEIAESDTVSIVAPSINVSNKSFYSDYKTNQIYWSISRISQCGIEATDGIMRNRDIFGDFKSLEDFIERLTLKKVIDQKVADLSKIKNTVFFDGEEYADGREARKFISKQNYLYQYNCVIEEELNEAQKDYIRQFDIAGYRSPINSRVVQHLIFAGSFDKLESATSVVDRWGIMVRASKMLGFELKDDVFTEELVRKHYFWSGMQIMVSGIGSVDYHRIFKNSPYKSYFKNKGGFINFKDIELPESDGKRVVVCATISEIDVKNYTDKKTKEEKQYVKMHLSQNDMSAVITFWNNTLEQFPEIFSLSNKGQIIMFNCNIKWSDWDKKNMLTSSYSSNFFII